MPWTNFIIYVLIFVIAVVLIIKLVAKWIESEQDWKEYEIFYRRLHKAILNWEVDPVSYFALKNAFVEIRKLKRKSEEEIEVLEIQFLKKYYLYKKMYEV